MTEKDKYGLQNKKHNAITCMRDKISLYIGSVGNQDGCLETSTLLSKVNFTPEIPDKGKCHLDSLIVIKW